MKNRTTVIAARASLCCVLLAAAIAPVAKAQDGKNAFVIEGRLAGIKAEKVYLVYDTGSYHPTDSAVVKDGKYSFRGTVEGVSRVSISLTNFDRRKGTGGAMSTTNFAQVFIDKGTVQVVSTGTMEQTVVKGSRPEEDFRVASGRQDLLMDSLRQIVKVAQQEKNDVWLQMAVGKASLFGTMMQEDYTAFVRKHPASPIDVFLLRQMTTLTPAAGWMDTVAALYQGLAAGVRNTRDGRDFGGWLSVELKTALGHQAPDFTQKDAEGRPVSLSSFKGKYVLLDFWASWDNNASRALPVLAKAYQEYGSKGLVVLGVSLDKDRDSWQQVIQEANAGSTMQVSDLKGRDNAAARLYGVTNLPRNLLIDPSGIIVARNLTSLTLGKTLSFIFE